MQKMTFYIAGFFSIYLSASNDCLLYFCRLLSLRLRLLTVLLFCLAAPRVSSALASPTDTSGDTGTIAPIGKVLLKGDAMSDAWLLIDNFEQKTNIDSWIRRDTRNDTIPRIGNPQVTEIRAEADETSKQKVSFKPNKYLIKKPAAEGVVGNRKALTYKKLPETVAVGETYTFFTRFQVEYFPNNHVFGLSNLSAEGIAEHDYNAFEPSLRITDKIESDGTRNDGTLMVKKGNGYEKIFNLNKERPAKPLSEGIWYSAWYIVNNELRVNGGQTYDVYLLGGEFSEQTLVYTGADFRMKREKPLTYFLMNCNTGPADKPYGNGGILYDDLYMVRGRVLSLPKI